LRCDSKEAGLLESLSDVVAFSSQVISKLSEFQEIVLSDVPGKTLKFNMEADGQIRAELCYQQERMAWRLVNLTNGAALQEEQISVLLRDWLTNGEVPLWI
jgi:hypothetical protein